MRATESATKLSRNGYIAVSNMDTSQNDSGHSTDELSVTQALVGLSELSTGSLTKQGLICFSLVLTST